MSAWKPEETAPLDTIVQVFDGKAVMVGIKRQRDIQPGNFWLIADLFSQPIDIQPSVICWQPLAGAPMT